MEQWIEQELASCQIGDKRLDKRYLEMLDKMNSSLGKSLPATFEDTSELIAAYRFLNNNKADYESLMAPHLVATKQRLADENVVLAVQDTTSLDFTSKRSSENMGHLEHKNRRGLLLHLTLAISPERVCNGIISSKIWTRDLATIGKKHKRKDLPIEEKESYRWIESQRQTAALAKEMPEKTFICIGDRENDIYEAFVQNLRTPYNVEILIRCTHNRKLSEEDEYGKLFNAIANSQSLGRIKVGLPARPGKKKRTAQLELRSKKVKLKAPLRPDSKLPEVEVTIVQAKEIKAPKGEKPIEWNLLTSLNALDYDSCLQIVNYYKCRWEIEIFFKILKSGCRVEDLHLEKAARLKTALALYMVLSWRVHYIMMLSRERPKMLADKVFDTIEIKAIYIMHEKKLPKKPPNLKTVAVMLAQTGGYLARKNDPPPGPKAFWVAFGKLTSNVLLINKLERYV